MLFATSCLLTRVKNGNVPVFLLSLANDRNTIDTNLQSSLLDVQCQ